MDTTDYANASNVLVYSAMITYAASLIAFAVGLGTSAGLTAPTRAKAAVGVGVGVGGGGVADAQASGDGSAGRTLSQRCEGMGVSVFALAALLNVAAVVARGLATQRPPWGNMYEFAVTGSALVAVAFMVVVIRPSLAGVPAGQGLRWLGTFVAGPVLLTLGIAVTVLYTEAAALVPALQEKFWLAIHVFIAMASSALFTVAFSITVIQLIQERLENKPVEERPRFMRGIPGSVTLESVAYRLNAVAFPLWTFTIIAGAIWAQKAWGRYWNWDPKEVWSFIGFVVYAAYLHARATGGWSRRAAWLGIAGFACILINVGPVNWFASGLHSYADVP